MPQEPSTFNSKRALTSLFCNVEDAAETDLRAAHGRQVRLPSRKQQRSILAAALLLALAPVSPQVEVAAQTGADSESRFPYQAIVAREDCNVRSGPGQVHYATQKLQPGDVVEVYRHDPGGWLAIRPPQGSFSIVPESAINLVRDGVGEITVDDTWAWVGTRLDPVDKPMWQIKLRAQEQVSVLGELSWPGAEGHSTIWYQIEPPPGEFRWVHRDDLQRLADDLPTVQMEHRDGIPGGFDASAAMENRPNVTIEPTNQQPEDPLLARDQVIGSGLKNPPTSLQRAGTPAVTNPAQLPTITEPTGIDQAPLQASRTPATLPDVPQVIGQTTYHETPADSGTALQGPQDHSGINQGWRRSSRAIREAGGSLPDSSQHSFRQAQVNNSARQSPITGQRYASSALDRQSMVDQLNQSRTQLPGLDQAGQSLVSLVALESVLTGELLKPDPAQWTLEPIREMANRYVAQGTPEQRQQAMRLLEKVQGCLRLKQAYTQTGTAVPTPSTFTATAMGDRATAGGANSPDAAEFDAVGRLNQMTRQQGALPNSYVLQDDSGKITHIIEPIPGLNLQRYLKQRIGVKGKRGVHQQLNLQYVRVERAFPLN